MTLHSFHSTRRVAAVLGSALFIALSASSALYIAERAGIKHDWQRALFIIAALLMAGSIIRMVARHDRLFGERVTLATGIFMSIAITGPIAATALFQGDYLAGVVISAIGVALSLIVVFTVGRREEVRPEFKNILS